MGNERKEPVRIRRKELSNGNISLYLDIYCNKVRSYEFLKLYLIPEKSKKDKRTNEQTMQLAEAVKAQRIVDIQSNKFGFKSEYKEDTNFLEFYNEMLSDRKMDETKGNYGNWSSCLVHLKRYDKKLEKRTFKEIDKDWILGFKKYLESTDSWKGAVGYRKDQQPLSMNSRVSYFNKLKACIKHAFETHVIGHNPMVGIEGFKYEESERMYLTIDEVRRLSETECRDNETKRAFLFSCLTGIRRSDIERLTWNDVHKQGEFTRIIFKQKKTKGQEYLDVSEEAEILLGERGNANDKVFRIRDAEITNSVIRIWCEKAGIDKDITFHCARHTFATMMLDIGTDIYTVSKLLGHRELSTTQIYAKVLDKNKQNAVRNIPKIL